MISANDARAGSDSFAEKTSVQAIYTAIEPELMKTIEEEIRLAMTNGDTRTQINYGRKVEELIEEYLSTNNIYRTWDVKWNLMKSGDFRRIDKTIEVVLQSLGYQASFAERVWKRFNDDGDVIYRHTKWLNISWANKE